MSPHSDRSPSVHARLGSCLAAPAEAGQRVSTPQGRNFHQWRAIAYFLAGVEVMARGAEGAPLAGKEAAQRAGLQAIPDGNHGDNRRSIK